MHDAPHLTTAALPHCRTCLTSSSAPLQGAHLGAATESLAARLGLLPLPVQLPLQPLTLTLTLTLTSAPTLTLTLTLRLALTLACSPYPHQVQLPLFDGNGFTGVVDLLTLELLVWERGPKRGDSATLRTRTLDTDMPADVDAHAPAWWGDEGRLRAALETSLEGEALSVAVGAPADAAAVAAAAVQARAPPHLLRREHLGVTAGMGRWG